MPSQIIITNTVFEDVDSTNIIQKARLGYITLAEAKKKFNILIIDTVAISTNNSIIDTIFVYGDSSNTYGYDVPVVQYMESDTIFTLTKYTKTDSLEVILELKQRAYLNPFYVFEDSLKLIRLSHTHIDTLLPVVLYKPSIKDKATWFMIGAGSMAILSVIARIL